MTAFIPFLVSVVLLTTAIRSETSSDGATSSFSSPNTDGNAKDGDSLEGEFQARFKRSPSASNVAEVVTWKDVSVPKVEPSQGPKGKESDSDAGFRSRSKEARVLEEGKSRGGHEEDRGSGNLEETLEEKGDEPSSGGRVVWSVPSLDGSKPSATNAASAADASEESIGTVKTEEGHRKLGEDSEGVDRPVSVSWSKQNSSSQGARNMENGSRTRRDLSTLKRMLDDDGVASVDSPELPEEEEPPEMYADQPEIDGEHVEVPRLGDSRSGEAIDRQDFSKRPKYYPDWGPKRTWRINMMRVWGKRHLAGYDKEHALWNN